jgi:hypothetical protein
MLAVGAVLFGIAPAFAIAQTTGAAQGLSGTTAFNWSGYVSDSGTYTAVSGNWIIPAVANANINTTSGASADATWVGIGGVSSHDLIQAGTEAVPTIRGGMDYQAWYELLPGAAQIVPLTVHTGDAMSVSVAQDSNASGLWTISFTDTTTGQSYSTTVNYASSLSSAEWIEEMPAGVGTSIALDNFGSINFTGGSAVQNGNSVTIAGSGAQPLTMANTLNQPLAIPSTIGADGASFSITRTNAASSAIGVGNPFGNSTFITGVPIAGGSSTGTPNTATSYGRRNGHRHGHYSYSFTNNSGTIAVVILGNSFGF